ncbi:MAG: hypothetical protein RL329_3807 [Bacteroidota bacterium]|jgi:hypothetical protein
MNKKYQIIVITVVLLLHLFSMGCQKDTIQTVPAEFQEYVNLFFEEGNKRGMNIALKNINLEMRFSTLVGKNAACTPKKHLIEIDSALWRKRSPYDKAWLIYHELGHCILGRDHLLKTLPRGECQSVMSNSEGFNCMINFKSNSWKKYYFDELFNNTSIIPDWYQDTIVSLNDTMQLLKGSYVHFQQDSFVLKVDSLDSTKNFALEVDFDNAIQTSRDLCLRFDDKLIHFTKTPDFNITEIKNTKKYFYAGASNVVVGKKITLKIIKKDKYYIFAIDNHVIHVMDYEPVQEKIVKILCFSTESNFNYEIYYFK